MKKKALSISKKLRFEIFKRDSFKCQYCGASAPEVLLQIDHIKPIFKGGEGDAFNLITSCQDCNLGKGKRELSDSTTLKKQKAQLDELQLRREQIELMMNWVDELRNMEQMQINRIAEFWNARVEGFTVNNNGKHSIKRWLKQYTYSEITEAIEDAVKNYLRKTTYDTPILSEEDAIEKTFHLIPRICNSKRLCRDDPELKEVFYIRGIVRNKCKKFKYDRYRQFKAWEILELLNSARKGDNVPLKELRYVAYHSKSLIDFQNGVKQLMSKYRKKYTKINMDRISEEITKCEQDSDIEDEFI